MRNRPVECKVINLSSIPSKVDPRDIQANGKILSDQQIATVEEILATAPASRYSRGKGPVPLKNHGIPYGIIKTADNNYYAVYKGDTAGKTLGKGGFGKVKLAQNLKTGEWVALKIQEPKKASHTHGILHESQILNSLGKQKSPLMGRKKAPKANQFGEVLQFNMLMEWVPGMNLRTFLCARQEAITPLPAFYWLDIIIMMIKAVQELHAKQYLHRDIKPDNFMYDPIGHKVTLIDVGFAKEDNKHPSWNLVGTPYYLDPQLARGDRGFYYNTQTDVYSLGKSIQEILGIIPAVNEEDKEFINNTIFKNNREINQFLQRMIDSPAERPSLPDAVTFFEKMRKKLIPLPHTTIGILDIGEYIKTPPQQRKNFIAALKLVDQVILVNNQKDNRPYSIKNYLAAIQSLEKVGIAVRKEILTAVNHPNLMAELEKITNQEKIISHHQLFYFSQDNNINETCKNTAVSPILISNGTTNQYKKKIEQALVTDSDFTIVISSLNKWIGTLKKEYPITKDTISNVSTKRIALLESQLTKITALKENKAPYAYTALTQALENLQQKMLESSTTSSFNFFKTVGEREITNLQATIENKINRPK